MRSLERLTALIYLSRAGDAGEALTENGMKAWRVCEICEDLICLILISCSKAEKAASQRFAGM